MDRQQNQSLPEFENFNRSPFHIKLGSKMLYSTGTNQNKSLWAENENTLKLASLIIVKGSKQNHQEILNTSPLQPTRVPLFAV